MFKSCRQNLFLAVINSLPLSYFSFSVLNILGNNVRLPAGRAPPTRRHWNNRHSTARARYFKSDPVRRRIGQEQATAVAVSIFEVLRPRCCSTMSSLQQLQQQLAWCHGTSLATHPAGVMLQTGIVYDRQARQMCGVHYSVSVLHFSVSPHCALMWITELTITVLFTGLLWHTIIIEVNRTTS
jgi:hypothetical protein